MSTELKSTMDEETLEGVGGLRISVRSWRRELVIADIKEWIVARSA
jgi:hypothetical protein